MRDIAITATAPSLEAEVDARFGRASHFILISSQNPDDWEATTNPALSAGGGAGVAAGQFLASRGVKALLTGNVGPNAFSVLQAAGIAVFPVNGQTVREAYQNYLKNNLSRTAQPTKAADHLH